jgi:hypothetical protein
MAVIVELKQEILKGVNLTVYEGGVHPLWARTVLAKALSPRYSYYYFIVFISVLSFP